jgi:hypothetical protein
LRPKIPGFQPTRHGVSLAQQAGTHTVTLYVQQVQGSTTHKSTATGGGGTQHTGSGAQQSLATPVLLIPTLMPSATNSPNNTDFIISLALTSLELQNIYRRTEATAHFA